jgi:hypothetical protein
VGRWWGAVLVFLACFSLYFAAPVMNVGDSRYALATSLSLLERGSLRIDPYLERKAPVDRGYFVSNGEDYQVEMVGEKMYHFFPLLPGVMATPLVWFANAMGTSLVGSDGRWSDVAEARAQKWISALLVALSLVFAFLTASALLSQPISLIVAFCVAFGSQYYSSLSRAMWSDTWGCLLASVMIWHLVRRGIRSAVPSSLLVGVLMVGLFACRPQLAIVILPVFLCLALRSRSQGIELCVIGLIGLAFFALMSLWVYGASMPAYFLAGRLSSHGFWERFAGSLMSPSRGTLVFMPSVGFAAYLSMRYWRWLPVRYMVVLGGAIFLGVHVLIGLFPHWWGGASYGPRLSSAVVPWIGVVLSCAWVAQRSAFHAGVASRQRVMAENAFAVLAIAASILMNLPGAWSFSALNWNGRPSVDLHPERLWDWRNPQFLSPFSDHSSSQKPPSELFPVGSKIKAKDPRIVAAFGAGWSGPHELGRLTTEETATLYVPASEGETLYFRFALAPIPADGRSDMSVSMTLRGEEFLRFPFPCLGFSVVPVTIPSHLVSLINEVVLHVSAHPGTDTQKGIHTGPKGAVLLGWVARD